MQSQHFREKSIGQIVSRHHKVTLCKQIRANFNNRQVKTHVQTACKIHDLNMFFHSFHNGLNYYISKKREILEI